MRSSRHKPDATSRKARVVRSSGGGRAADADSKRFRKLGGKLGNQGLDEKVKKAGDQATALLQFIAQRLDIVKGTQRKELLEMADVRQWYKAVAKGKAGYHLPDPTRWHDTAHFYLEAAKAICNGHLGRGADLLDRAMEAERAAYDSVPVQVREKLGPDEVASERPPAQLGQVATAALCPRIALPQAIAADAAAILNVEDHLDAPALRRRRWFEEGEGEEEEEEEEDEDD